MSVERRLSAQTRPVRVFLALSVGLGTLTAVAVLLQAWLLAGLVSTSFTERVEPADLVVPLTALLGVVLVRAGLAWTVEIVALDAGRVLERGTHADLVATGRVYPHLWRREREVDLLADGSNARSRAGLISSQVDDAPPGCPHEAGRHAREREGV